MMRCLETVLPAIVYLSHMDDNLISFVVLLPRVRFLYASAVPSGIDLMTKLMVNHASDRSISVLLRRYFAQGPLGDFRGDLLETDTTFGRHIAAIMTLESRCDFAGCMNTDGPSDMLLKTFECAGHHCLARYCCRTCQVGAWKRHRKHCGGTGRRGGL